MKRKDTRAWMSNYFHKKNIRRGILMKGEFMKSVIKFRVRYQETDQMGVVHHSVYYIWYEMGRTELMRKYGLSYRDCETRGWLLPVIESWTQYINSAHYDDLIEVETISKLEKGCSFVLKYTVTNSETGQILSKGYTKHVLVDTNYKISREATKMLRSILINGAV